MTVPLERQKNIADVAERVRQQLGLGSAAVEDTSAFATAEQGEKADEAAAKLDGINMGNLISAGDTIDGGSF